MSEMLERGAAQMWAACGDIVGDWRSQPPEARAAWRANYSRSLLAALDPEDETLARWFGTAIDNAVAFQTGGTTHMDHPQIRAVGETALAALRSRAAQGGHNP